MRTTSIHILSIVRSNTETCRNKEREMERQNQEKKESERQGDIYIYIERVSD